MPRHGDFLPPLPPAFPRFLISWGFQFHADDCFAKKWQSYSDWGGGLLKYNLFVLFSGSSKIIFWCLSLMETAPTAILSLPFLHSHFPTTLVIHPQTLGLWQRGGGVAVLPSQPLPWGVPTSSYSLSSFLLCSIGKRRLKPPTPEAPWLCVASLRMWCRIWGYRGYLV